MDRRRRKESREHLDGMSDIIDPRQNFGQRAEDLVANHLRRSGYTIRDRNWRTTTGELDIIAECAGEIVFVEVRARHGPLDSARALALESVNGRKQARLLELAEAYLNEHELDHVLWRIDVAAVAANGPAISVEIIRDAVAW